jgi:hypothetical protein
MGVVTLATAAATAAPENNNYQIFLKHKKIKMMKYRIVKYTVSVTLAVFAASSPPCAEAYPLNSFPSAATSYKTTN